jgi:hypothetical protein
MKNYFSILALSFICSFGKAQITAESVTGIHSGFHNWQKLPLTLELRNNFTYEMTSYNYELQSQSTIKGRWRIEGDRIILTDLVGTETLLQKTEQSFYVVGKNGMTCMASFQQNKSLEQFWKTFMSASGC